MSKQISYGGKTHTFPDDFTDADIQSSLSAWDAQNAPKPPGFKPQVGVPIKPVDEQYIGSLTPGKIFNIAARVAGRAGDIVAEEGPTAIGAIGGATVGGIPGAIIGGGLARSFQNQLRESGRFGNLILGDPVLPGQPMTPDQEGPPAPQNIIQRLKNAALDVGQAGASSAMMGFPQAAAARYPAVAASEAIGAEVGTSVPAKMTAKAAADKLASSQSQKYPFEQRVADMKKKVIDPLLKERTALLNTKTLESAKVTEGKTLEQIQGRVKQVGELRTQTAARKQQITEVAQKETEQFAEGVGQRMDRTALSQGAEAARTQAEREFSGRTTKLINRNREIFNDNVVEVPTGKMKQTGIDYETGDVITEPVMEKMATPVDTQAAKDILKEMGDRLKNDLRIARDNGSKGSSAVLQIMDGPRFQPADSIYDLKAALNQVGYGQADAAVKPAEAIAKRAAYATKQALEKSVGEMKGGDEVLANFKAIADNQAARDELLRTGGVLEYGNKAISTAKAIEGGRDLYTIAKNPVAFKSWWPMADETTKQGAQRAIADHVIGDKYSTFVKRWKGLPDEVKQLLFTPEKIASGDALATRGSAALRELTDATIAKHTQIIKGSEARLKELARARRSISDYTVEHRGIMDKIREARQTTDATARDMNQNFQIDIETAKRAIAEAKAFKQKLIIGGGVVAASGIGGGIWKSRSIAHLLGWVK